jgi:hypothetical protein
MKNNIGFTKKNPVYTIKFWVRQRLATKSAGF